MLHWLLHCWPLLSVAGALLPLLRLPLASFKRRLRATLTLFGHASPRGQLRRNVFQAKLSSPTRLHLIGLGRCYSYALNSSAMASRRVLTRTWKLLRRSRRERSSTWSRDIAATRARRSRD